MEITPTRPATELASLTALALQNSRFKERREREAESDVKSEVVYYSPVIRIDTDTASAVIQYRDSKTGEVQREYPHVEQGVTAYKQTQDATKAEVAEVAPVKAEVKEAENVKEDASVKQQRVDEDA